MAPASRIKEHWREQQLFNSRILLTVFMLLTLIALVVIRLVQLQVLKYDYYSAQSSGNQIRAEPIPPIRGLILDRNGKVLADNKPSYQLEITPERVPDMQDTLNRLVAARILAAGDLAELRELLASRRSFET
ncbi:MAG: penicillin-binding protein 2, partial [Gammaproteobacteria bacterium]|nr:penicillin-binding protein 2 [Gammaproteobacteria bacterium]